MENYYDYSDDETFKIIFEKIFPDDKSKFKIINPENTPMGLEERSKKKKLLRSFCREEWELLGQPRVNFLLKHLRMLFKNGLKNDCGLHG